MGAALVDLKRLILRGTRQTDCTQRVGKTHDGTDGTDGKTICLCVFYKIYELCPNIFFHPFYLGAISAT